MNLKSSFMLSQKKFDGIVCFILYAAFYFLVELLTGMLGLIDHEGTFGSILLFLMI